MSTTRFFARFVAAAVICAAMGGSTAAAQPSDDDTSLLTPTQAAWRDILSQRLGVAVAQTYAERGFRPIWLSESGGGLSAHGQALIVAMANADAHALPTATYAPRDLSAATGRDLASAATEADLTAAFLAFARSQTSGLLEPRRIDPELHVDPERPEPGVLLQRIASAREPVAALANLAPATSDYASLLSLYQTFRLTLSPDSWGAQVPQGPSLRPGTVDARVSVLRDRLMALGDLDPISYGANAEIFQPDGTQIAAVDIRTDADPAAMPDHELYDPQMVAAVKRFQRRHGLNEDGIVGPATRRQLNASPLERLEQIAVNLERSRWLNRDLGAKRIVVNLAAFTMDIIEDNRTAFTSRVVVGQSRQHRTPEFSDLMTHVVVNPSWNVPRSIATEEILPILRKDPDYLVNNNMSLVGADTTLVDWTTVTPATFPGRIVQSPGNWNALGSVKFLFPNEFAIYLHDTPAKRLFSRDVRAFSHGCIRVERPHDLAMALLAGQATDPDAYFNRLLSEGRERWVTLEHPLPVHITYRTAWVDPDGTVHFRGDVYGRDRTLATALRNAGVEIAVQ